MSLLDKLQYSADSMSFGEKLLASMQVTLLGVGIVFFALLLLFFVISIMSKMLQSGKKPEKVKPVVEEVKEIKDVIVEEEVIDEGELIAVITAAVAASLHTSTHNIVVKNIVRVGNQSPTWGSVGILERVNG